MAKRKRCQGCDCLFYPRLKQSFCAQNGCQKKRKCLWQREKRSNDLQYRENDADARKAWAEKHRDYWGNYRINHPKYTSDNREKQKVRNQRRRVSAERKGPLPVDEKPQEVIELNGNTYVLQKRQPPSKPLAGRRGGSLRQNRFASKNEDVELAIAHGRQRLCLD